MSATPPNDAPHGPEETPPRERGLWGWARALLPWVFSLGLLGYVLFAYDLAALGEALRHAQYGWYLLLAGAFLNVLLLLDALFFYVACRWLTGSGQFGDMVRARAVAYSLTILNTFAGLGGLAVYLKRHYGIRYRIGTGIMINELLAEVGAFAAVAFFAAAGVQYLGLAPHATDELVAAQWFGIGFMAFYGLCYGASRIWPLMPEAFQQQTPLTIFVEMSTAQYGVFLGLKIVKNIAFGIFVALALPFFGVQPPAAASVAFTQIILLVRGLPVSAFGIGFDQITFPALFHPWAADHAPDAVLAFSMVYTATLLFGRVLIGLPFLRAVIDDLRQARGTNDKLAP